MRIGMMTGLLTMLQVPLSAPGMAFGVVFFFGMLGGMALSSKLDALARKDGES